MPPRSRRPRTKKREASPDWRIASGPSSPPVWATVGQSAAELNSSFETINAATRGALEIARYVIVDVVRENPAQDLDSGDTLRVKVRLTEDGINTAGLIKVCREAGFGRRDMVHMSVVYVLAKPSDMAPGQNAGTAASYGIRGAAGLSIFQSETP